MKTFLKISTLGLVVVVTLSLSGLIRAATSVNLRTADSFAVLAGSTVTNTGPTVITGDLGLSPGSSVTGFPPGVVSGTQHVANATALQAKTDLVTAYNDAAGQTSTSTIAADLGGQTLTPGVYTSASSIGLTGALTLDGGGNADAVFIFQAGSSLTTASASSVVLTNGTQACNVFWQIGSSATLGTTSVFRGNILALTSITLTTGATVDGRVLARNGAVTLDSNTITRSVCTTGTNTNANANTNTSVNSNTNTSVNTNSSVNTNTTPTNTNTTVTINVNGALVAAPGLPSTGVHSDDTTDVSWSLIILAGIVVTIFGFFLVRKQRAT